MKRYLNTIKKAFILTGIVTLLFAFLVIPFILSGYFNNLSYLILFFVTGPITGAVATRLIDYYY